MICRPRVAAGLLLFSLIAETTLANDWELRSESVYSTGKFGGNIRTEVLFLPLEIRRRFEWGEVGLTVPYLWYNLSGSFTFAEGTVDPQLQTIPISGSAEGLSDILIDAQYYILRQSGLRPEVILRGYWKPPTGDESRGLGTGTHDWILGVEFWSWIPESERWFYFGDVYRYFAGDSDSRDIDDTWIYDFGIGGIVFDNYVAKVAFKAQTSLSSGLPSAEWIDFESEYKVCEEFTILSGFTVGLSDAAPDWSIMLGFEQRF